MHPIVKFFRLNMMALIALAMIAASTSATRAQGLPIVRDAEVEALLREYAAPIFKAAGLRRGAVEIVLVNSPSYNAFVAGRRIFINTGALMTAETPNEIIGVIAHETGHIVGGHQERLREQIGKAQIISVLTMLLGAGAVAAAGRSGAANIDRGGGAFAALGPGLTTRALLAYKRGEETNADRAAVNYLNKTKQSARGMLTTFKRFSNNLSLQGSRVNPYLQSHPMPRERILALESVAKRSRYYAKKDSASLQLRHDMMRAKIAAYTGGPAALSRAFRRGKQKGFAWEYGKAISAFLRGSTRTALPAIDRLIKRQPKNRYLHEIKGEMLLRAGKADAAAKAMGRAVKLDRNRTGLLRIQLGQALVATNKPKQMQRAIGHIKAGLARDPNALSGYRTLALAYGRLGQVAQADLATAEGYFRAGNVRDAKQFANRAKTRLKRGSPGWLRADDILRARQRARK